jgi:hypothetical protein
MQNQQWSAARQGWISQNQQQQVFKHVHRKFDKEADRLPKEALNL